VTAEITPLRDHPAQSPRIAPYNTEAEQRLLGALLLSNHSWFRVSELLRAERFGNAVHGRIYAAIGGLVEHGQSADPINLGPAFEGDAALETLGGGRYLWDLAEGVVTLSNAEDYGRHILDRYVRRQLIAIGEDIVATAYHHDAADDAAAQIERAEAQLFALAHSGAAQGDFRRLAEALKLALANADRAFKAGAHTAGIATGLADLDRLLGGLHPSDLVILAERPSMGKTALATGVALAAARAGATAGIASLEMSAEQLATRILGEAAGIPGDRIRRGVYAQGGFGRFVEVERELGPLPLWIDDTPGQSLTNLPCAPARDG
jgi:replicative DNA helicase